MTRAAWPVTLGVVIATGCGGSTMRGPGPLRFHNQAPVTVVNDRVPGDEAPDADDQGLIEYYFHTDVVRPTRRALTIDSSRRAENVNSLGEVPDSAWFTNRTPTPAEVERGPGGGGPDRSAPWRVVGVKVGGAAIGITIEDARDDKYILKFDEPGHPEIESAADVIVQRLTWAFGYNVPDNQIVTFPRTALVLDREAVIRTRSGHERPMTEQDLEKYLGMADSDHGTFRALASRYIDGKIVGGIEAEGVRAGDPNDRVPHELRRDLRGQRVLWAWVNHWDLKTQNTLATYTDGKYVRWYALDFGESLGAGAAIGGLAHNGHGKMISFGRVALSLVSFGAYVHPWEHAPTYPALRGLGHFDSATFDFARWVPAHNWRPTDVADRQDELWAAEILHRLTPAHVEAAVAAGRYSDPRTRAYMVKTLLERRRIIGRRAFSRVAPLVRFAVRERAGTLELCFADLWLQHDYGAPATTRYRAHGFDHAGARLGPASRPVAARGARTCVGGLRPGASDDGYTIVELEVTRAGDRLPPVFVHVARGPEGFRVIGLDRR